MRCSKSTFICKSTFLSSDPDSSVHLTTMASLYFSPPFLVLAFWVLIISQVQALTCTSQKFDNNKLYANCSDLPSLNSYLHYTYNSSNSSLSIAFIAPPAKSDGWIGWGINLNGTGMAGAQALIALKSDGKMVVKTYNLVSYKVINESKLSFDVWDLSAESNGTDYKIFASVKVPNDLEKLNQIWQVGPSTTNGKPDKHDFNPANLQAKSTLNLVASSPTAAGNGSTGANSTGAGYRIQEVKVGFYLGLSVIIGSLIGL
ncbi:hypothetical protein K2173_000587 [Erythroxylum novogranatense]|uniref:DOMON domain-containing protein n=1 Tax=Erythroxylum novogranatense TaxID=1862640 RepID=A0AAV8S7P6_9ROSI|nr:hypothetical protein K2173_000587 [Erythroxylum novogranatense]